MTIRNYCVWVDDNICFKGSYDNCLAFAKENNLCYYVADGDCWIMKNNADILGYWF